MVMLTVSNVFVLPVLLLVSIPLVISASVTISLAVITLFLRALVVYVELALALLANFFLFPAHSPSTGSLLTFSEANTPGSSPRHSKSRVRHVESTNFDVLFPSHHRYHDRPTPSRESFFNLVNGKTERDFEGVGGWRTPVARKQTTASSSSSVSFGSEDGIDDQAWLSMNKHLQLPSRPFTMALGTSTSNSSTSTKTDPPRRPRFHQRSVTTSSLIPGPPRTKSPSREDTTHQGHAHLSALELRASKSTVGLETLSSTSPAVAHSPPMPSEPFLMPSGSQSAYPESHIGDINFQRNNHRNKQFGRTLPMIHYPVGTGLTQRRRRSSSSSMSSIGVKTAASFSALT